MAFGNVPTESPGSVAQSSRYNQLVANVDNLDTRLDVTEALTTNTSGTVGTGNQRLSDRLGAGITTAATADDRLGAGVGTGSNVTTGSAASQLADLRSRATALEGPPLVQVTLTADQAIASTTETPISWGSAPRNPNTMWSAGNPTRLTVPAGQGGLYLICGTIAFQVSGTGGRALHARVNGAGNYIRLGSTPGISTIHSEMSLSVPLILAAGDYVEINAWQNSGGSLNILGTVGGGYDPSPRLMMLKIRA